MPAPLEFRVANFEKEQCDACRPALYENSLGQMEEIFVSDTPTAQLAPDEIAERKALRLPEGTWVIAITMQPEGWRRVLKLANDVGPDSTIAVISSDFVLGTYSVETIRVSHGTLSFDFMSKPRFELALNVVRISSTDVGSVTFENLKDECRFAAGGNPEAEARCLRIISTASEP